MGIIKAAIDAAGGTLRDQWLEVIEPDEMGERTVFTRGVKVRTDGKRSANKGGDDIISNGSVIRVYPNQFMILVDGGKIVDYTAQEGYYTVNSSSQPSLFNGDLGTVLDEAFDRVRFAGSSPQSQRVYYVNLQEIKGIKFGTRNPINYFDNFYNSELFLRAHGAYSIKITNPILFYTEVVPRNAARVEIESINEQYLFEFLDALQSAINQLSADGVRISFVTSKGRELSKYMSGILDEDWSATRGIEVQAVALASISYDEESQKLINMRNQGAMLGDPSVRDGYVQGAMARGMEAAGSNPGGSMNAFMGMNMAGQAMGGFVAAAGDVNSRQQPAPQAAPTPAPADSWACGCGTVNTGKFCSQCGKPTPAKGWTCVCGTVNTGKFCSQCGKPAPVAGACPKCGCQPGSPCKFCPECGAQMP